MSNEQLPADERVNLGDDCYARTRNFTNDGEKTIVISDAIDCIVLSPKQAKRLKKWLNKVLP